MIWAFLGQIAVVRYKLELRFEWCATFGPIYFEMKKEHLLQSPLVNYSIESVQDLNFRMNIQIYTALTTLLKSTSYLFYLSISY